MQITPRPNIIHSRNCTDTHTHTQSTRIQEYNSAFTTMPPLTLGERDVILVKSLGSPVQTLKIKFIKERMPSCQEWTKKKERRTRELKHLNGSRFFSCFFFLYAHYKIIQYIKLLLDIMLSRCHKGHIPMLRSIKLGTFTNSDYYVCALVCVRVCECVVSYQQYNNTIYRYIIQCSNSNFFLLLFVSHTFSAVGL